MGQREMEPIESDIDLSAEVKNSFDRIVNVDVPDVGYSIDVPVCCRAGCTNAIRPGTGVEVTNKDSSTPSGIRGRSWFCSFGCAATTLAAIQTQIDRGY